MAIARTSPVCPVLLSDCQPQQHSHGDFPRLTWVVRAATPWLMILLFFLILVTYIPQISLWLPEYIDKLKGY